MLDKRVAQSIKSEYNHSYMSQISLQMSKKENITKHLNLDKYKIEPCENDSCDGNKKLCPYYHSKSDKRRSLKEIGYSPQMCQFGKNCLKKKCNKAHNKYEINYHPNNYRRKYCKNIFNLQDCQYKLYCSKAHSTCDVKVELLNFMDFDDDFFLFKFKTEFCPINWEHNYQKCVYAHSWEDFRRNIIKIPYSQNPCDENDNEDEMCANLGHCQYSHGWFESNYHPLNYKKSRCDHDTCDRTFCPFLHPGDSKRFMEISKFKDFYMYPYNRIVPGKISNTKSFFKKPSENILL